MFLLVPETYHFYGKRTKRESEGSVLITNEKQKRNTHTQKRRKQKSEMKKKSHTNEHAIHCCSFLHDSSGSWDRICIFMYVVNGKHIT